MKQMNELTFETEVQLETQNKVVGRPSVALKDKAALEAILKNDETRKVFKEQVDNLVHHKRAMLNEAEIYRDDVGAVSEKFSLSKKKLNAIIGALAKDKEGELAEDSEGLAELLQEVFL
jgi:Holliday junction resolvase RusA-like endonuclease